MIAAIPTLSIGGIRKLLLAGEVSVTEVVRSLLERIEALNPKLNAFITVLAESALADAKHFDTGERNLSTSPLAGIPLAVKDVLCIQGVRTTCGSKILENYRPPFDATVIARLRQAGAMVLGKTNMDEFAMGSSTENSAFGPVHNPWHLDHVPGGSSGGSAAAVAADLCAGALGSDTGGSIRQPAAFCGVVGLKPTYGRVSRFGLVAFASSLDQIGPITKTVEDAALLLQAIAGHDPADSTAVDRAVPNYTEVLNRPIAGLKLGLPKEYLIEGIDPEVRRAVMDAVQTGRELGAEIVEISLPHTEYGIAAYYIIAPAEASSNLARYDGVKYGYRHPEAADLLEMYQRTRSVGFGAEVKRRIMLGTYSLSAGYYDAYYKKASQVRSLIRDDFLHAFRRCDAILAPAAPHPAFKIGEKAADPLQMYLSDVFTLPASLAGIPGISIPCGISSNGLPIGLQVLGPHFGEPIVLRVAHQLVQALPPLPPKPLH